MIKLDPLTLIGAGFLAIGGITTMLSPSQQAITTATNTTQINAVATEVATESLAAQTALANERYDSGACIRSTISITEGMAVNSVYSGGIICDKSGMTAAIASNGRLVLLARTGDQTKITQGLQ